MSIDLRTIWPWSSPRGLRRTDSPSHRLLALLVASPPIGARFIITDWYTHIGLPVDAFGTLLDELDSAGQIIVEISDHSGRGFGGEYKKSALSMLLGGSMKVPGGQDGQHIWIKIAIAEVTITAQLQDKGHLQYHANIAETRRDILDRFVPFLALLTLLTTLVSIISLVVSLVPRTQTIEVINWPSSSQETTSNSPVVIEPSEAGGK